MSLHLKNKCKILQNKKGIETGLTDFYATIIIFLIILIFFFVLQIKTNTSTYHITGEELSFDATQIALVYAQSYVATSKGEMTFADFAALAAADSSLEKELQEKTEQFFSSFNTALSIQLAWKINSVESENKQTLVSANNYDEFIIGKGSIGAAETVEIPLQNPGDFVEIKIQPLLYDTASIVASYDTEK